MSRDTSMRSEESFDPGIERGLFKVLRVCFFWISTCYLKHVGDKISAYRHLGPMRWGPTSPTFGYTDVRLCT